MRNSLMGNMACRQSVNQILAISYFSWQNGTQESKNAIKHP
ncbi:hypothetical protein AB3X83_00265 (plasmid) [Lentilactobacillus buchneri]